jgi:hypothetical protein
MKITMKKAVAGARYAVRSGIFLMLCVFIGLPVSVVKDDCISAKVFL